MNNSYVENLEDGTVRPEGDYLRAWEIAERQARRVAWDEEGDVRVSTVFLVIDHNWGICPDSPPILYVTMICRSGHWENESQERYHTRAEAMEGHRRACLEALGREPNGAVKGPCGPREG